MFEEELTLDLFNYETMAETIEALHIDIESKNHASMAVFTLRNMAHLAIYKRLETKLYRLNSNFTFSLIQKNFNFQQTDHIDLTSVAFYQ